MKKQVIGAILLCLVSVNLFAKTKIAILDFELNDLTLGTAPSVKTPQP